MPLRTDGSGPVVATLQVKTVCTLTDRSATIVISGALPTT